MDVGSRGSFPRLVLLAPANPLLPSGFVVQHFDKDAADDGPRLEPCLFAIRGPIPVG